MSAYRQELENQLASWERAIDSVTARGSTARKLERDVQDALRATIRRRLHWNALIDDASITVTVTGGNVRLTGAVGSAAERRRAVLDAWTAVVRSVDATGLEVEPWMREEDVRARRDVLLGDAEIAENLARALVRDPFLADDDISVEVERGRVQLLGTVESYFDKGQAQELAYRASGVIQVRNSLSVEQPARLGHDPYVDDWRVYDYTWYQPPLHPYIYVIGDWEIVQDIEGELFWSPFVDADQVTVAVDDGVATLTGTVDSYREFAAAAENALEGGAIEVRNQLQVE